MEYNMLVPSTTAGLIFPPQSKKSGFKYGIGEYFVSSITGSHYEITGYSILDETYKTLVSAKGIDDEPITYNYDFADEEFFSGMDRYASKSDYFKKVKVATKVIYRIHFFDMSGTQVKGQKAQYAEVKLSNIRALAKYLNAMLRINPNRRVAMVSIVDDSGVYVDYVRFMKREIKEQKFLTGAKERLLAHAKYECGYEIATNF